MGLPNTYTDVNETGCCGVPNIDEWDDTVVTFENKPFIRLYTKSFLFMPLNMGRVMTRLQQAAEQAGATMPPQQAMTLSRDISPWKAEQLYAVSEPVDGADNLALDGTYLSKVFEGPYRDAKKWYDTMQAMAKSKGKTVVKTYFFYTTCPNCAKHYGHNYTIVLADITE